MAEGEIITDAEVTRHLLRGIIAPFELMKMKGQGIMTAAYAFITLKVQKMKPHSTEIIYVF